jgi:hypothetical protein
MPLPDARAGDAEQHLIALMPLTLRDKLGDGLRLIAFGLELEPVSEGAPH